MLAAVIDARRHARRPASRRRRRRVRRTRVGGPRARAARPSAPSGSGGRPARCPSSTAIDRARARGVVDDALARRDDALARAAARRARCSRPTASRSSPERVAATPTRRSPRPRSSVSRPSSRPRVAGAHKTETGGVALDLPDEDAVREAAERIGGPVVVQPMIERRRRAPRRASSRTRLRPARRVRARRRDGRADRRRRFRIAPLTDVDARGARPRRQGRAARARLPRRAAGRRRARSSTSCTASRGSPRTCPRSPSST